MQYLYVLIHQPRNGFKYGLLRTGNQNNRQICHWKYIEKSTVPCKTASIIDNTLKTISSPSQNLQYQILSNLEFLADRKAVHDLLNAERILIGEMQTSEGFTAIGQLSLRLPE